MESIIFYSLESLEDALTTDGRRIEVSSMSNGEGGKIPTIVGVTALSERAKFRESGTRVISQPIRFKGALEAYISRWCPIVWREEQILQLQGSYDCSPALITAITTAIASGNIVVLTEEVMRKGEI